MHSARGRGRLLQRHRTVDNLRHGWDGPGSSLQKRNSQLFSWDDEFWKHSSRKGPHSRTSSASTFEEVESLCLSKSSADSMNTSHRQWDKVSGASQWKPSAAARRLISRQSSTTSTSTSRSSGLMGDAAGAEALPDFNSGSRQSITDTLLESMEFLDAHGNLDLADKFYLEKIFQRVLNWNNGMPISASNTVSTMDRHIRETKHSLRSPAKHIGHHDANSPQSHAVLRDKLEKLKQSGTNNFQRQMPHAYHVTHHGSTPERRRRRDLILPDEDDVNAKPRKYQQPSNVPKKRDGIVREISHSSRETSSSSKPMSDTSTSKCSYLSSMSSLSMDNGSLRGSPQGSKENTAGQQASRPNLATFFPLQSIRPAGSFESTASPTDPYMFSQPYTTSQAERVLMGLGFGAAEGFLPERFLRDWYTKISKAQTESQIAPVTDLKHQESRDNPPPNLNKALSKDINSHIPCSDFNQLPSIQMLLDSSSATGIYEASASLPSNNSHNSKMERLREYIAAYTSNTSSIEESVEVKMKQHAMSRQKSLPLCLETLSKLAEGKSRISGMDPFDKEAKLQQFISDAMSGSDNISDTENSHNIRHHTQKESEGSSSVKQCNTRHHHHQHLHRNSSHKNQNAEQEKTIKSVKPSKEDGNENSDLVDRYKQSNRQCNDRKPPTKHSVSSNVETDVHERSSYTQHQTTKSNQSGFRGQRSPTRQAAIDVGESIYKDAITDTRVQKKIKSSLQSSTDDMSNSDRGHNVLNRHPHQSLEVNSSLSKDSIEVADIMQNQQVRDSTAQQRRERCNIDQRRTLKSALKQQVEPAMVSIVLEDTDQSDGWCNADLVSVSQEGIHLVIPLSACNPLSLSPIPQSPVTVIEVSLDNQQDSLDTEGTCSSKDTDDDNNLNHSSNFIFGEPGTRKERHGRRRSFTCLSPKPEYFQRRKSTGIVSPIPCQLSFSQVSDRSNDGHSRRRLSLEVPALPEIRHMLEKKKHLHVNQMKESSESQRKGREKRRASFSEAAPIVINDVLPKDGHARRRLSLEVPVISEFRQILEKQKQSNTNYLTECSDEQKSGREKRRASFSEAEPVIINDFLDKEKSISSRNGRKSTTPYDRPNRREDSADGRIQVTSIIKDNICGNRPSVEISEKYVASECALKQSPLKFDQFSQVKRDQLLQAKIDQFSQTKSDQFSQIKTDQLSQPKFSRNNKDQHDLHNNSSSITSENKGALPDGHFKPKPEFKISAPWSNESSPRSSKSAFRFAKKKGVENSTASCNGYYSETDAEEFPTNINVNLKPRPISSIAKNLETENSDVEDETNTLNTEVVSSSSARTASPTLTFSDPKPAFNISGQHSSETVKAQMISRAVEVNGLTFPYIVQNEDTNISQHMFSDYYYACDRSIQCDLITSGFEASKPVSDGFFNKFTQTNISKYEISCQTTDILYCASSSSQDISKQVSQTQSDAVSGAVCQTAQGHGNDFTSRSTSHGDLTDYNDIDETIQEIEAEISNIDNKRYQNSYSDIQKHSELKSYNLQNSFHISPRKEYGEEKYKNGDNKCMSRTGEKYNRVLKKFAPSSWQDATGWSNTWWTCTKHHNHNHTAKEGSNTVLYTSNVRNHNKNMVCQVPDIRHMSANMSPLTYQLQKVIPAKGNISEDSIYSWKRHADVLKNEDAPNHSVFDDSTYFDSQRVIIPNISSNRNANDSVCENPEDVSVSLSCPNETETVSGRSLCTETDDKSSRQVKEEMDRAHSKLSRLKYKQGASHQSSCSSLEIELDFMHAGEPLGMSNSLTSDINKLHNRNQQTNNLQENSEPCNSLNVRKTIDNRNFSIPKTVEDLTNDDLSHRICHKTSSPEQIQSEWSPIAEDTSRKDNMFICNTELRNNVSNSIVNTVDSEQSDVFKVRCVLLNSEAAATASQPCFPRLSKIKSESSDNRRRTPEIVISPIMSFQSDFLQVPGSPDHLLNKAKYPSMLVPPCSTPTSPLVSPKTRREEKTSTAAENMEDETSINTTKAQTFSYKIIGSAPPSGIQKSVEDETTICTTKAHTFSCKTVGSAPPSGIQKSVEDETSINTTKAQTFSYKIIGSAPPSGIQKSVEDETTICTTKAHTFSCKTVGSAPPSGIQRSVDTEDGDEIPQEVVTNSDFPGSTIGSITDFSHMSSLDQSVDDFSEMSMYPRLSNDSVIDTHRVRDLSFNGIYHINNSVYLGSDKVSNFDAFQTRSPVFDTNVVKTTNHKVQRCQSLGSMPATMGICESVDVDSNKSVAGSDDNQELDDMDVLVDESRKMRLNSESSYSEPLLDLSDSLSEDSISSGNSKKSGARNFLLAAGNNTDDLLQVSDFGGLSPTPGQMRPLSIERCSHSPSFSQFRTEESSSRKRTSLRELPCELILCNNDSDDELDSETELKIRETLRHSRRGSRRSSKDTWDVVQAVQLLQRNENVDNVQHHGESSENEEKKSNSPIVDCGIKIVEPNKNTDCRIDESSGDECDQEISRINLNRPIIRKLIKMSSDPVDKDIYCSSIAVHNMKEKTANLEQNKPLVEETLIDDRLSNEGSGTEDVKLMTPVKGSKEYSTSEATEMFLTADLPNQESSSVLNQDTEKQLEILKDQCAIHDAQIDSQINERHSLDDDIDVARVLEVESASDDTDKETSLTHDGEDIFNEPLTDILDELEMIALFKKIDDFDSKVNLFVDYSSESSSLDFKLSQISEEETQSEDNASDGSRKHIWQVRSRFVAPQDTQDTTIENSLREVGINARASEYGYSDSIGESHSVEACRVSSTSAEAVIQESCNNDMDEADVFLGKDMNDKGRKSLQIDHQVLKEIYCNYRPLNEAHDVTILETETIHEKLAQEVVENHGRDIRRDDSVIKELPKVYYDTFKNTFSGEKCIKEDVQMPLSLDIHVLERTIQNTGTVITKLASTQTRKITHYNSSKNNHEASVNGDNMSEVKEEEKHTSTMCFLVGDYRDKNEQNNIHATSSITPSKAEIAVFSVPYPQDYSTNDALTINKDTVKSLSFHQNNSNANSRVSDSAETTKCNSNYSEPQVPSQNDLKSNDGSVLLIDNTNIEGICKDAALISNANKQTHCFQVQGALTNEGVDTLLDTNTADLDTPSKVTPKLSVVNSKGCSSKALKDLKKKVRSMLLLDDERSVDASTERADFANTSECTSIFRNHENLTTKSINMDDLSNSSLKKNEMFSSSCQEDLTNKSMRQENLKQKVRSMFLLNSTEPENVPVISTSFSNARNWSTSSMSQEDLKDKVRSMLLIDIAPSSYFPEKNSKTCNEPISASVPVSLEDLTHDVCVVDETATVFEDMNTWSSSDEEAKESPDNSLVTVQSVRDNDSSFDQITLEDNTCIKWAENSMSGSSESVLSNTDKAYAIDHMKIRIHRADSSEVSSSSNETGFSSPTKRCVTVTTMFSESRESLPSSFCASTSLDYEDLNQGKLASDANTSTKRTIQNIKTQVYNKGRKYASTFGVENASKNKRILRCRDSLLRLHEQMNVFSSNGSDSDSDLTTALKNQGDYDIRRRDLALGRISSDNNDEEESGISRSKHEKLTTCQIVPTNENSPRAAWVNENNVPENSDIYLEGHDKLDPFPVVVNSAVTLSLDSFETTDFKDVLASEAIVYTRETSERDEHLNLHVTVTLATSGRDVQDAQIMPRSNNKLNGSKNKSTSKTDYRHMITRNIIFSPRLDPSSLWLQRIPHSHYLRPEQILPHSWQYNHVANRNQFITTHDDSHPELSYLDIVSRLMRQNQITKIVSLEHEVQFVISPPDTKPRNANVKSVTFASNTDIKSLPILEYAEDKDHTNDDESIKCTDLVSASQTEPEISQVAQDEPLDTQSCVN